MPRILLPEMLRRRAGTDEPIPIGGSTVGGSMAALEDGYPGLRGWILDEQGRIREHVKLFVNDRMATLETPVADSDELHVVPAISGG